LHAPASLLGQPGPFAVVYPADQAPLSTQ